MAAGDFKLKIDVDYHDDGEIKMVDGMLHRLNDYRPVFDDIRADIEETWAKNYTSEGLLVGGWKPLSPSYAAWKSIHFPGAPIMVQTGRLFASVSDLRGAPNEINKKSATFGTDVPYAEFHQYGRGTALREIVFDMETHHEKWGQRIAKYVEEGDS